MLGQGPNALVGVQLWCVGGETLQAQTRMVGEQLIQRRAFMGGGIVQKHDHWAVQVSKQMAEEDAHFLLPDIVEPKLVIETEMLPLRTNRDPRDDGDSLAPIAMAQERSLAREAHVLTRVGINRNPDSSTKTRWAPSRAAFFLPAEPVFLLPALDGLLVALHRATLGFLVAPVQAVHQPPDMIPMIVDSELALDQHRNSCCRPLVYCIL